MRRRLGRTSAADRMARIVRQEAAETGKLAEFSLVGDVSVHPGVLDKLMQALEHLLRNSIAHGIETPETRSAGGKPRLGSVRLIASQSGSEVDLRLVDDGAGVNVDKVRARAESTGLLSAGASAADILDVIFKPGFSTADSVSQLAGRGVGMDVVRSVMTELGGTVVVQSSSGHGAEFRLRLPTDTSVISALPVRVGKWEALVPASIVERVITTSHPGVVLDGAKLAVDGQQYDYHRLAALLDSPLEADDVVSGILLLRGTRNVAVGVEDVGSNRRSVLKSIGRHLRFAPGLLGMTVSDTGGAMMVLNPVALAAAFAKSDAAAPVVTAQAAAPAAKLSVMVVDDSLTVRRVTMKFLEAHKMDHRTAKDGLDGIEQIKANGCPDVILLDLEMPRMNGFDFAEALREHERGLIAAGEDIKHTPIIMITSRAGQEYKDKAAAAGIDSFMTRPYHEESLLAEIDKLTSSSHSIEKSAVAA